MKASEQGLQDEKVAHAMDWALRAARIPRPSRATDLPRSKMSNIFSKFTECMLSMQVRCTLCQNCRSELQVVFVQQFILLVQ
jgi:hypothetical protein